VETLEMQKLKFLLPLVLVLLLAACGGGGGGDSLAKEDVAVVGHTHIDKAQYDALLESAKQSYKAQGQAFPKVGTSGYETVKAEAVSLLVSQAERDEEAKSMGVTVTAKQIDDRLAEIKKQYFSDNPTKYKAYLKQNKLTDASVRQAVREQLISQAVFDKVTKDVTVSDKDVHAYYQQHISQYTQQPTRDVRYILVKDKKTADSVYSQLKSGNLQTWCTLAKKYAKDASGQNCGKATFSKGQTVAVFDKAAFSAPTNVVHAPFYDPTQYKSWFVIEPIGAVKKASVQSEKSVADQIKQQLLQTKKNTAMTTWVGGLKKTFCSGKIKYQTGYVANPDPCAATTAATTG
jgi:peptidyl-prolyl cis-trans isomerase C